MRMHFELKSRYLNFQKSQNISHFVKFQFRPVLAGSFPLIFKKLDWWFSIAGINKTKLLIDLQSKPPSIILYCSWKYFQWIALNIFHFSVPMLSVETVLGMMTNLPCNITPSVPGDQVQYKVNPWKGIVLANNLFSLLFPGSNTTIFKRFSLCCGTRMATGNPFTVLICGMRTISQRVFSGLMMMVATVPGHSWAPGKVMGSVLGLLTRIKMDIVYNDIFNVCYLFLDRSQLHSCLYLVSRRRMVAPTGVEWILRSHQPASGKLILLL